MGSSPGRKPGRGYPGFGFLVCVQAGSPCRASRVGQEKGGLTKRSSLAPGAGLDRAGMAPPASRELTPTTERKAWLKGVSLPPRGPLPPQAQPTPLGPQILSRVSLCGSPPRQMSKHQRDNDTRGDQCGQSHAKP